jgi:hypothetical protein
MNFLLASSLGTSQLHQVSRHSVACVAFRLNAPFVAAEKPAVLEFDQATLGRSARPHLNASCRTPSASQLGTSSRMASLHFYDHR